MRGPIDLKRPLTLWANWFELMRVPNFIGKVDCISHLFPIQLLGKSDMSAIGWISENLLDGIGPTVQITKHGATLNIRTNLVYWSVDLPT